MIGQDKSLVSVQERKKKVGRPRLPFTQRVADKICELIISKHTIEQVCQREGLPSIATLFKWLKENPAFAKQYALALEIRAELLFDDLQRVADDATNDYMQLQLKNGTITVLDREHVQRSKLRCDMMQWRLSKMLPKKYGDMTNVRLGDPDGKALPPPVFGISFSNGGPGLPMRVGVIEEELDEFDDAIVPPAQIS